MTKAESKAAAILGRKGGSSKSEAKALSARENGKLGGRPSKITQPITYRPELSNCCHAPIVEHDDMLCTKCGYPCHFES